MKTSIFYTIAITTCLLVLTTSCLKTNETPNKDSDVTPATDLQDASLSDTEAKNEFSQILNIFDAKAQENIKGKINISYLPECVEAFYKNDTLSVNFAGDNGCLCNDGRTRSGNGIAILKDKYPLVANSSMHIILGDDYTVNGYKVSGEKVATIKELPVEGNNYTLTYTWQAINTKVQTALGDIEWDANYTIKVTDGATTVLNPYDNRYEATGGASGINRYGTPFDIKINDIKPVIVDYNSCLTYPVAGQFTTTLKNNNSDTLLFDYDPDNDETCGKFALSINGGAPIIIDLTE